MGRYHGERSQTLEHVGRGEEGACRGDRTFYLTVAEGRVPGERSQTLEHVRRGGEGQGRHLLFNCC